MKKLLIGIILTIFFVIGSNSLPLFAIEIGDLVYTVDNPNAYDTTQSDYSSYSIDISDYYYIIGAYQEDDQPTNNSGKAYIFDVSDGSLLYTLDNPNGYATPNNDYFGYNVSISNNFVVVGAYQEDDSSGTGSGKVYVFDLSDGSLLYTLDNPNPVGTSSNDYFGYAVSNTDDYVVVGAYREDDSYTDSGKAYIFDLSDGSLLYTLDNPNGYGTSQSDYFGEFVDISDNYVIAGARTEDELGAISSGKAYIFDLSDGSLLYTLDNPNAFDTAVGDNFGWSVGISNTHAIAGAWQEDDGGGYNNSGKAYIFDLSDGSLLYTLDNPNAYNTSDGDYFGYGVAISDYYAIAGAYQEDDDGGTGSGKAYIFDLSDGSLTATLDNPNAYNTSNGDYFGRIVAIAGDYAIANAYGEDDDGGTTSGKSYVFYCKYVIPQYTISFETNGGNTIDDITLNENTVVTPPTDPTRDGYIFVAWYTASGFTVEYTFSTMTENITLYARWVEGGSGGTGTTGGLTNNSGFIFIAILLYFALLFLRYKTGARIWSLLSIGILIFLLINYSTFLPMIIVLVGVIIYQLYDTFKGGN